MASCPSCGADGGSSGGSCPRCGANVPAVAGASLELDVPVRKPQRASPKKKVEVEVTLELAVDPRSLIQPRAAEPPPPSGPRSRLHGGPAASAGGAPLARVGGQALATRDGPGALAVGDVGFDAQLLADYGDAPAHRVLSGLYAWRVLKRQREIKSALVGRREEAARTATALEDALVGFAERAKAVAEHNVAYGELLADARRAEETLRSRDAVLAADQDAHNARLAAVTGRLAALEAELAGAQSAERVVATEIASNQGALGRAEAKLKRAESELRTATRDGAEGEP